MAASLASLPTTFCLSHGDECSNRSPTISSFPGHSLAVKRNLMVHSLHYECNTVRRLVVTAATEGSRKSKETQPSWANPDSDEPPPWARDEGRSSTSQESFEVPFYVYLLASAITAIAAIGSVLSTRVRIQCSGSWTLTVSFILMCLDSLLLLESQLLYSYGTNPLKLLIRKLRNKIKEMDIVKTLCAFCIFYSDCCSPHTYEDNYALLKELVSVHSSLHYILPARIVVILSMSCPKE